MVQISDHRSLTIDEVREAPVVALNRLKAAPAILQYQSLWRTLRQESLQLQFPLEGHVAIRNAVHSGSEEHAAVRRRLL